MFSKNPSEGQGPPTGKVWRNILHWGSPCIWTYVTSFNAWHSFSKCIVSFELKCRYTVLPVGGACGLETIDLPSPAARFNAISLIQVSSLKATGHLPILKSTGHCLEPTFFCTWLLNSSRLEMLPFCRPGPILPRLFLPSQLWMSVFPPACRPWSFHPHSLPSPWASHVLSRLSFYPYWGWKLVVCRLDLACKVGPRTVIVIVVLNVNLLPTFKKLGSNLDFWLLLGSRMRWQCWDQAVRHCPR